MDILEHTSKGGKKQGRTVEMRPIKRPGAHEMAWSPLKGPCQLGEKERRVRSGLIAGDDTSSCFLLLPPPNCRTLHKLLHNICKKSPTFSDHKKTVMTMYILWRLCSKITLFCSKFYSFLAVWKRSAIPSLPILLITRGGYPPPHNEDPLQKAGGGGIICPSHCIRLFRKYITKYFSKYCVTWKVKWRTLF